MKNKYTNPIINQDMSDPDVIKYKDGYLMVTSSFNFCPGLPLYFSKDLVNWKFVRYLVDKLPGKKFNSVHFGHGIWAPSIRMHKDIIYVTYPLPDEGVFQVHTKNPFSKWSKPHRIIKIKGYEDPCPIWINNKAYIVHAFVKSRIGFNSKLAIFEVDEKLKKVLTKSKIIYDGTFENKTIEGPKFNVINDELFILAPAGGVEKGYQLALKSKSIYGPYEYKVILKGYEDTINGPHQGALVEYVKDKYVFFHFQDKGALGRVLHLQPAIINNNWPLIGKRREEYTGAPLYKHNYYLKKDISIKENYSSRGNFLIDFTYPCNNHNYVNEINNVYYLKSTYNNKNILLTKSSIYKSIPGDKFKFVNRISFKNVKKHEHSGLIVLGSVSYILEYFNNELIIKSINMDSLKEEIIYKRKIRKKEFKFTLKCNNLSCLFYVDGKHVGTRFILEKGKWVGSKIGLFSYSEIKKEEYGDLTIYSSFIK